MPHDEGNKMTVVAWPRMRVRVVAFALAGAVAAGSMDAHAEPRRNAFEAHSPRRYLPRAQRLHSAGAASTPVVRTTTLLDFDTTQRDGHLTPDERRLLRQHIEDAVRELYKR
ncbi:MAG: hypothetical protein QOI13_3422 [Paraburkholderia sp.]|nr:hypothetical protein [Paraburkholderia sp.]